MKYNEIRDKYQNHDYLNGLFIDPYAMLLSPIFTKMFLQINKTPNQVTIYMIISGILGAILFTVPNIIFKIIGIIFIHSWYILDCSDGEVARITRKFSKFGKELDYTAHIINHPLFNLAFMITILSLERYNELFISILFGIYIVVNLIKRNLLSFHVIYDMKIVQQENNTIVTTNVLKRFLVYIINSHMCYPNFAIIFPIIYLIDYTCNTHFAILWTIVTVFINIVFIIREIYKWIVKIKTL